MYSICIYIDDKLEIHVPITLEHMNKLKIYVNLLKILLLIVNVIVNKNFKYNYTTTKYDNRSVY